MPIVSIIIGEGGSGGALAMAVSDQVWMLENSVYSILSPEGYASILWKDSKLCKKAAGMMKMTSFDLKEAGVIENIIPEPEEFTKDTMEPVVERLRKQIREFIEKTEELEGERLVELRYERYRQM